MVEGRIVRLAVYATVDETGEARERAQRDAAAGDSSWQEWLAEHDRGDALIVRLRVTAEFSQGHGQGRVEVMNRDVWLENDQHAPKVEEQVREIAYKDVQALRSALRDRGVDVTTEDLEAMMIHVELADSVLDELRPRSTPSRFPASRPDVGR
jgi:rhodanese-related sulfurtransferase